MQRSVKHQAGIVNEESNTVFLASRNPNFDSDYTSTHSSQVGVHNDMRMFFIARYDIRKPIALHIFPNKGVLRRFFQLINIPYDYHDYHLHHNIMQWLFPSIK